ncbi:hypothetical protein M422DRAFT_30391 [Sphaerobolus stellatus SS14]|uniref:Zinc-ribbon 15 domain-containing protein n=1 Tax=Sphaerobolus stellatus (strain SS14) TaxID=990650 RepID=A0A0C9VYU5_SPHS4|nr:hypothetical protein M422DRAFT_30391 [Sphaerobolus stellatus SS14]
MCIVFGCPTKISQDSDSQPARVCPRCHNAAVVSAKSRTWFELFFVPLFPFTSSRIWICGICNWEIPHQANYEPPLPGQVAPPGTYQPTAHPQPTYQPQPGPQVQPGHGYGAGQGK